MSQVGKVSFGFEGLFEGLVVLRAAESLRFYEQVGQWIYPEGLKSASARLLMKAVMAVAAASGRPPGSLATCVQRVLAWNGEGKVADDDFTELVTWLDHIRNLPAPSDEVILAETVPLVRRAYELQMVAQQANAVGAGASVELAARKGLEALSRIGNASTVGSGITGGLAVVAQLRASMSKRRVTTGSPELDDLLGGGLVAPAWYLVAGEKKAGKSAQLSTIFGASISAGRPSYAASVGELSSEWWLTRAYANLCNIHVKPLIEKTPYEDEVYKLLYSRLEQYEPFLAPHHVDYFPAGTPLQVIFDAVARWEQKVGVGVKSFILDYADKVSAPEASGEYNAARLIHDGGRAWCLSKDALGVTASQATRGDGKREVVGGDDMADSQHKVRSCDGGWSVNPIIDPVTGAKKTRLYKFVDRFGEADIASDDLDNELAFGRCTRWVNQLGSFPAWRMPEVASVR